uniref:Amidase domain-containing protein n=1 Tax=Dunaliella tertiolecta TaxID=3047 RepID=A0A7S3VIH0_DUNTE|mmetsp:Transcript_2237/g.5720  ORF Transcript_2237/g.5720 Transcript_2237/m.5720 type:complete len:956 (+) Transcript_2237:170-3037(+)|eukprot:CAMPEP_0202373760 /NCGR_PEP_ID=MMETSP1127-20130417/4722_1 /ASSEMBLY_ACC=CAM_ASM_000462 /TAXON_ID=3047 /ORGANISM="Dunaliella tertiolecta, Strain CCMP1320" /LENGTH=955 /DNA_ID=CAMNT_0048970735 /DNA_START=162 /DNA_END=3029 /DNA_ORIENTATION=-
MSTQHESSLQASSAMNSPEAEQAAPPPQVLDEQTAESPMASHTIDSEAQTGQPQAASTPSSSAPAPAKTSPPQKAASSGSISSAGKKKQIHKKSRKQGLPKALFALPVVALGAATLWVLRRSLARSPAGTKKKSGKHQTRSKEQQQQDAADALAEQEALALPELPSEPIEPDTMEVMAAEAQLLPPPSPPAPLASPPLSSMSFVVSENLAIEGLPTTHGMPAWQPFTSQPAATSTPLVSRAVAAGAACLGKTSMQGLRPRGSWSNLQGPDLIGANYGNPHNKTRVSGGSQTGAAVAVALGRIDFALAPDTLGEARVPAACCRVYAYRPTPGLLSAAPPGASSNSSGNGKGHEGGDGPGIGPVTQADSVCVVTTDAGKALKVAEGLGVPGSSNIRGEIIKFVVAQDLFDMCAPEFQPATLALKKAILKWAGSDQAGAVQLVRFLSSNVQGWQSLVPSAEEQKDAQGVQLHDFLEAMLAAAQTLQHAELHRTLGGIDAAAAAAAQPPSSQQSSNGRVGEGGASEAPPSGTESQGGAEPAQAQQQQQQQQQQEGSSEQGAASTGEGQTGESSTKAEDSKDAEPAGAAAPPVAEAPKSLTWLPPVPSPDKLAAAHHVARQVFECLRATVKPDTVMVLPALPFPPPKRNAKEVELDVFAKLTSCFNALGFLGACPTLTVPVGSLRDGSPVAISLLAVHKFDLRLLAVAKRLCPMIHDAFEGVKEEITQMAIKQAQAEAAAKAGVKLPEANGDAAKAQKEQMEPRPPAVDPKKLEKAEKAKNKGNEYYQAGKHADAINEYTKAIALNPTSHVYYSNRAIACIKLFRFEQAEEDCKRALSFDLSQKDKVKALLRRATARDALQKYDAAEKDLRAVLALEANNKQAREDLQALRQHRAEMATAQTAMAQQAQALKQQAQIAAAAGAQKGGSQGAAEAQAQAQAQQEAQAAGMDFSLLPPEFRM